MLVVMMIIFYNGNSDDGDGEEMLINVDDNVDVDGGGGDVGQ